MRITGFDIFRIAVWILIAVWVNPRLLDLIHAGSVGRWLLDHAWVRWLGAPPLLVLGFISVLEEMDTPQKRAARQALAGAIGGGTLVKLRHLDPVLGIPDGPGLRVPLGTRSLVVGTWKRGTKARTVATVRVECRSIFGFLARGAECEPAPFRGFLTKAIGTPIKTGVDAIDGEVVLRTSHPDAARTLFTASAVTSALFALSQSTRWWELSLNPNESGGTAELRLECPGTLGDADRLRALHGLMKAVLEELADTGTLAA